MLSFAVVKVDGIMESWVMRLATAVRTNLIDANVVLTDWLSLAQQHYPIAVQKTRTVGKDIAHLLQALQVRINSSTDLYDVSGLKGGTFSFHNQIHTFQQSCMSLIAYRSTTSTHLEMLIWLATASALTSLDLLGAFWQVRRRLEELLVRFLVLS